MFRWKQDSGTVSPVKYLIFNGSKLSPTNSVGRRPLRSSSSRHRRSIRRLAGRRRRRPGASNIHLTRDTHQREKCRL